MKDHLRKSDASHLSNVDLLAYLIEPSDWKSAKSLALRLLAEADDRLDRVLRIARDIRVQESESVKNYVFRLTVLDEYTQRIQTLKQTLPTSISGPMDIYQFMKLRLENEKIEKFYVLYLDRGNHIIQSKMISIGGVTGTVADPKVIFKHGISLFASGIILVHNHPSGQKKPSQADIQLTDKIREGAKLLDMSLLDHLIFTNHGFYSFSTEGLLK